MQSSRPAVCLALTLSWLQACGVWIILARNTLTHSYPIIAASPNLIVKMVSIIWLFFVDVMHHGGWEKYYKIQPFLAS